MMDWEPISEVRIKEEICSACERMTVPQLRLWEYIRIPPEKWEQHPYGEEGGGFWAVAIAGRSVVWYNDIEEGFNSSPYNSYGTISEYWCNQDQLEWTIQNILNLIESGNDTTRFSGPPTPLSK